MPKEPNPSTPVRRSARQRGTPPATPDSVGSSSPINATPRRHSPVPSSSTSTPTQDRTGVAKPPVVRTYARSGRYGVNLKRELSVISISSTESEVLPTAAEALKLEAAPPSSPWKRTLDEIRKCVIEVGTCSICGLFMRKPYITQCGHSWCSGCLKQYFRTKLADKIRRYAIINHNHYNHDVSTCTTVPEDALDQQLLINALRQHHCNLRRVFQYPCPTCRTSIAKAPFVNYALGDILETQRKALDLRISRTEVEETAENPFSGLFYNESVFG